MIFEENKTTANIKILFIILLSEKTTISTELWLNYCKGLKFYEIFGEDYEKILDEIHEVLINA